MYIFDHYIPYRNYYKNTFVSLQNNNLVAFGQYINKDFVIVAPYASYSSASYIIVDVSQSAFISSSVIPSDLQPYQFYITNTDIYNISNTNINQNIANEISAFMQYYNSVAQSQTSATNTANTAFNILSNISSVVNSTYVSITLPGGTVDPIYLNFNGNVTSWPTIYSLSLDQSLIISFTNSQTLFIPLEISNGIYNLYITQNINSYNSPLNGFNLVGLYPNNASAQILYATFVIQYYLGSVSTKIASDIYNAFYITWAYGSAYTTIINNSPFTKTVLINDVELALPMDPAGHLTAQIWNDYTTTWNMLGTIQFMQGTSGYLVVHRIA